MAVGGMMKGSERDKDKHLEMGTTMLSAVAGDCVAGCTLQCLLGGVG
jgi:hypothetical protein